MHTQKQKLANLVYDEVRAKIFAHIYKPGSRLSENQIANELNISRTPVREAMKMLSNENLVEVHNGAGIFVKMVTLKEIADIFQVRLILESSALRLIWDDITKEELEKLKEEWNTLKKRRQNGEVVSMNDISDTDATFHHFFAGKCTNLYLSSLLDDVKLKTRRFQLMAAESLGDAEETIRQHLEIIEFIEKKDLPGAESALRHHIQISLDYIVQKKQYVI